MRSQVTAAGPCPPLSLQLAPRTRLASHRSPSAVVCGAAPPARKAAGARARSAPARAVAAGAAGRAAEPGTQQRTGDDYFATDSRPIILFDGVCNLCNGGVNFMLQWDRDGRFRFAALQSPAGRALLELSGRRPDDISSIVLVEPGAAGSYTKSTAILRIAAALQAPLPLVAAALGAFPGFFKDAVYDQVATNRYSLFGRTTSCRVSDPRFEERFVS